MSNVSNNLVCQVAQDRHRNTLYWRNLWSILIFAFGAVLTVFLSVAIVFFLREDWLTGALSTFASVVNSVGVKWVVARRKNAVKEEERAFTEIKEACSGITITRNLTDKENPITLADELREKNKLFNRFL